MLSNETNPSNLSDIALNLLFHSSRSLASSMPRVLHVLVQHGSDILFQTQVNVKTYQ